jgi:integrase
MATISKVTTKGGQNRYQVRWWESPGHQRKQTFGRYEDARWFKTETERQLDTGAYVRPDAGRITLAAWYEELLPTLQLAPKTRALYELEARQYILPALGHYPLNKITKGHVDALYAQMREQGKGAPTIQVTHRLLSRLLSAAVDHEKIARNPAQRAKRYTDTSHAPQSREPRFLDASQVAALAEAVPTRDRALVLLLAYSGLRIGEASFLRVKHVDLFRRRVLVEGTASEVQGRRIEGATKTKKKRSVQLPAFLTQELMRHRAAFCDESDPEAYFFAGPNGAPLRANNWRKRVFYRACEKVGFAVAERSPRGGFVRWSVQPPHVHDLRHTAASLAIQAGAHPKAVQEMLGHASITMTMDRYSHLFDSLQEGLADRLDGIYRDVSSQPG